MKDFWVIKHVYQKRPNMRLDQIRVPLSLRERSGEGPEQMSFRICRMIISACLVMFVILMSTGNSVECAETVTIEPAVRYQTWDGWGTSLSWWATVVGGWSDKNRNAVADLFFDPETGLGLNIVRYNIGGQDDPSHSHMRVGGDIEGFWPAENRPYDWTADENQRKMLHAAIERGVDITEAFSCSPPYWMTVSGCSSGGEDPGKNNLKEKYYDEFADYLTEVVRHFRDEWGVSFTTLEPVNEAVSPFWRANGSQQGCHFDRDKQNQLFSLVAARLHEKGLTTELSAPDETGVRHTIDTFLACDDAVKGSIKQINTHTYVGTAEDRAELRSVATQYGKRLYMSEMCFNSEDPGQENSMKGALDIARAITMDLRVMQPEAWVLWQPSVNEYWRREFKIDYGLIHADYEGGTETWSVRKKYYGYAHYSRFIRPGSRMVAVDADDTVGFVDWKKQLLVIVTYNQEPVSRIRKYDLSMFADFGAEADVYCTSNAGGLVSLPPIEIEGKQLTVTEPGPSVSTYVVTGIVCEDVPGSDGESPTGTKSVSEDAETYAGRDKDAPWRAEAEKRIDRIRKGELTVIVEDGDGNPVEDVRVEVAQQTHTFWFGNEIRGLLMIADDEYLDWKGLSAGNVDKYRAQAMELFNIVAFGNDMVWNIWDAHGKETCVQVWNEWLEPNGVALRGIPLVWAGRHEWKNPPDLMELTPEQLRDRINTHIIEMMEVFDGIPVMWDVLNEPISEPDFIDILGRPEAVEWFKLARRIEPQAKLYCNDYGLMVDRGKLLKFIDLVRYLKDNGAPIDGVSPQSHFWPSQPLPSIESLQESFDLLAELGLEVYPDQFEVMKADESLQGDYTRDFYILAFSHPAVVGITHWGFWAGDIWIPDASWFREDWSLKPSGKAVLDLIFNKWWTDVAGTTNQAGQFITRGFLGKYEITATVGTRTERVTAELPGEGTTVHIGIPAAAVGRKE